MVTTNSIDVTAQGLITYDGAGTFTSSPVVDSNVIIGNASANGTLNVAPPTNIGTPLVSNGGTGSAPIFGTCQVRGGGTGLSTLSTYELLAGGTTGIGTVQQVSNPIVSGYVLLSKGSSALPAFGTIPAILSWSNVAGTVTFVGASTGFFFTAASTMLLTGVAQGDTVSLCNNSSGTVTITLASGQTIRNGSLTSSSGGTATSSAQGDSLTLVYQLSTSTWLATSSIGTWVLA